MHRDAPRLDPTAVSGSPPSPPPPPGQFADPSLEALLEEQRGLWRAGTPIPVEEYLVRYPALIAAGEDAATVIYQEFILRRQRGENVDLADYVVRFADCETELRHLHEADQFVNHLFAAPAPTKRVGTYELLEELGRGGMGIVYRARQQGLQRVVALKMLLAGDRASPADIDRFRNEAGAAAQLQHPGIVAVHDVGEHEGRHFFTMDFVEGKSLAELARDGPLAPTRAANYVRAIADAIHYAHTQGILHRDLKPSNILIDRGDRPRVTDFGLADWQAGTTRLTVTGQVLGTPGYMPPEQVFGQRGQVRAASDVYALGAILYELLTGRPTVVADTPLGAIRQVVETEPVAPRLLRPGVPRDLETICLKCLQKEQHRRYATAGCLADDLGRFLRGEPILARPIGNVGRLWRSCRRNPMLASLVAGVAFSLLAGTCASTYFAVQADRRATEAVGEQKRTRAAQLDSDHRLYVADMRLAGRAWEESQVPWLLDLLDRHRPRSAGDTDRRGFEWNYLHNLCHSARCVLKGHGNSLCAVAYSSDGHHVASGGQDGFVRVSDAATGRLRHELRFDGGAVCCVAFSPDGKRVAAGGKSTVDIWDVDSGAPLLRIPCDAYTVTSLAFRPDGTTLATAGLAEKIALWDTATGQSRGTLPASKGHVEVVAYNPQGTRLAAATTDGTVTVRDLVGSAPPLIFQGHRPGRQALAFSPDGLRLAFGREDNAIGIWNVAAEKELPAITGHTGPVTCLAFSPEGWLASASNDQTVRGWDIGTGRQIHILRGHTGYAHGVAVSPNSRALVSCGGDNTVLIWDITRVQESLALEAHAGEVNAVAFRADGQRLASAGDDGTICIWDAARNLKVATLRGHRGRVFALAFSPDGRRLATGGEDAAVRVWDADGYGLKRILEGHTGTVWAAAFSPDGERLATSAHDGTMRIWDTTRGHELFVLKGETAVSGIAFSPDGRQLASAGWDSTVRLWNAADGQELRVLRGHTDSVWRLAFSADGERLASVGNDRTVRIWDVARGEVLQTLRGHNAQVSGVAFSPDGTRVASSAWDGTVRVWDPVRGEELLTLKTKTRRAFAVAFSPDGHRLAATTLTGAVQIWDATPRVP